MGNIGIEEITKIYFKVVSACKIGQVIDINYNRYYNSLTCNKQVLVV